MSPDAGTIDDHEPTPQAMKVRGQVRHSDGTILAGKTVRAFDRDLRAEQLLGEHETNSEGRYEIQYSADQFSQAEKKSADLIVRAFDDAGIEIASSAILFNAAAEETIDLVVDSDAYRGPSEYERLVRDLIPLMQGLSFAALTEDDEHQDISFLSGETEHSRQRIEFLIIAHRLAQKTELPPEAFYAFFRKGLPTNLPSLILQGRPVLRLALEAALFDHIVPAKLRDDIGTIIAKLKQLLGPHVLQAPDVAATFPSVGLLGISGLSAEDQEKALNLFIENEGPPDEAWKRLRSELKDGPADDLEFTLQMGKLTQNNIPVVQALNEMRAQGIVRSTRDLVRSLDAQAWTDLINNAATGEDGGVPPGVPGASPQEKVTNYVNGIIETLKDRFPTTFAGVGVSRQPQIDTLLITQVLKLNPDLDPSRPFPSSLNLTGLSADEQVKAKQSIDSLRQEIRMFPDFDYQQALSDVSLQSRWRTRFEMEQRNSSTTSRTSSSQTLTLTDTWRTTQLLSMEYMNRTRRRSPGSSKRCNASRSLLPGTSISRR